MVIGKDDKDPSPPAGVLYLASFVSSQDTRGHYVRTDTMRRDCCLLRSLVYTVAMKRQLYRSDAYSDHGEGMEALMEHGSGGGILWLAVARAGPSGLSAAMIRKLWGVSASGVEWFLGNEGYNVRVEGEGRTERVIAVE